MAKEISLLFPGQGSQFTGMLTQDLISSYKDIIDEASDILEIDFISLINDENDTKLNQTSFTQPALLLTSYLFFLKYKSLTNIKPTIMAGHSLGEYSALVASDSINFYDALKIVRQRGLLWRLHQKDSWLQ
jgi:[acyl-carrier-protein] S-malonyltransferase